MHPIVSGVDDARPRGRPRKNPDALARWTPPEGWSRLVAWISPEEKKALKRVAVDADVSVADLVRALAGGLAGGVITPEELIGHVRKGQQVMEKIPTLFERDDHFHVVDRPRAECAWVFDGEGTGTEKLDGTNVRLTVRSGQLVRVEKRRNPSKVQKQQGIVDGWYVDTDEFSAEDKWILEAARNTDVSAWPDGEHSCEALGPAHPGQPARARAAHRACRSTSRCPVLRRRAADVRRAAGVPGRRSTAGSRRVTWPRASSSTTPTAGGRRSSVRILRAREPERTTGPY